MEEEVNSVGAALRNTFMNKIPTGEDIRQTCNALASRLILDEASRTECKLALVDLLDEALQGTVLLKVGGLFPHLQGFVFLTCVVLCFFVDVTIYEPDADMIFNYLMVSALANATEIIEKKNLKATGGILLNLKNKA